MRSRPGWQALSARTRTVPRLPVSLDGFGSFLSPEAIRVLLVQVRRQPFACSPRVDENHRRPVPKNVVENGPLDVRPHRNDHLPGDGGGWNGGHVGDGHADRDVGARG